MTPAERFAVYADMYNMLWAARRNTPGDWDAWIDGGGKKSSPCGVVWSMRSPSWIGCEVNEPLQTTLVDIVRVLEEEGISFALIGGQATSLRGQERVTADIDLVIAVDVQLASR